MVGMAVVWLEKFFLFFIILALNVLIRVCAGRRGQKVDIKEPTH